MDWLKKNVDCCAFSFAAVTQTSLAHKERELLGFQLCGSYSDLFVKSEQRKEYYYLAHVWWVNQTFIGFRNHVLFNR
jgi:hypothetical protein